MPAGWDKDGNFTEFSKYQIEGVLNLTSIFPDGVETAKKYIKRKKGFKGILQHVYRLHDNSEVVRKVFIRFLEKVLTRVADGDMFVLPGIDQANITLKPVPNLEERRQCGGCMGIDIVKCNFMVPLFKFDFGVRSLKEDFEIYVPKHIYDRACRNAENGNLSWAMMPKTLNRYVSDEGCDDGDVQGLSGNRRKSNR